MGVFARIGTLNLGAGDVQIKKKTGEQRYCNIMVKERHVKEGSISIL